MDTALDSILALIAAFATLAGFSALVAALIAFARWAGWIQSDEQAGKASATLNLVVFVILVALGIFRPDLSLGFLDGLAARLATIALFILGLLTQIAIPAPVFRLFNQARVPVLGVIAPPPVTQYRNYSEPKQGSK